jgi:hypothetical protein
MINFDGYNFRSQTMHSAIRFTWTFKSALLQTYPAVQKRFGKGVNDGNFIMFFINIFP